MRKVFYIGEQKCIRIYEKKDINKIFIIECLRNVKNSGYEVKKGKSGKIQDVYYKDFITFDIETTSLQEFERWNSFDRRIGFMYLAQFYIGGKTIFLRTYDELFHFFKILSENCEHKLVIYVHNLSFEWQFIKDILPITKVFAIKNRTLLYFESNKLQFRCSYKLSNMSLEKYTESFSKKYFKMSEIMDYYEYREPNSRLDYKTCLYSALDVLSLYDAVKNHMIAYNFKNSNCIYTSTGFVRKEVRKALLSEKRIVKNDGTKTTIKKQTKDLLQRLKLNYETYLLTEECKAGGNTHGNRKLLRKKLSNLGHVDITSSYPYCMVCLEEYQMGKYEEIDLNNKAGLFDFELMKFYREHNYFLMFDIELFNVRIRSDKFIPIPYLSKSRCKAYHNSKNNVYDNGRILKVEGVLQVCFYDLEFLECFLPQYDFDFIKCIKAYKCKRGFLPMKLREEVAEYFYKKTSLKGIEEQEYFYMKSKNMVNGVYGMCYTNPVRDSVIFENNILQELKYGVKQEEFNNMSEEQRNSTIRTFIEKELEKDNKRHNKFLAYQWGSVVAMLGRVYLQEIIDAIPPEDVVYCDTDSMFYIWTEENEKALDELSRKRITQYEETYKNSEYYVKPFEFNKKGEKSTLGELTKEPIAKEFITLGAKKYAQVYDKKGKEKFEITIAGVPKNKGSEMMQSCDNFYCGYTFKNVKKMLTYNDNNNCEIVQGETGEIKIYSNICFSDTDYTLDVTDELERLIDFYESEFYYSEEVE